MMAAQRRNRPDGWWYPWIYVAGFLVVLAVNGYMLHAATSTFSGLTASHPFAKGNAYNSEIAADKAQRAEGWKSEFGIVGSHVETDGSRRVAWRFTVSDPAGKPVSGLAVTAQAVRPTAEGYDHDIPLTETAAGTYTAESLLPLKGQWEVRLIATRPGDAPFRLRERVQVP